MKGYTISRSRPSFIIRSIKILEIIEEIVINKHSTLSSIKRNVNISGEYLYKYIDYLLEKGIIKEMKLSNNSRVFTMNETNEYAKLLTTFIVKWFGLSMSET